MSSSSHILHITDPHLNFCGLTLIQSLATAINNDKPLAIVITGDISEAPHLESHLRLLESLIDDDIKIYFVCGNHDYYRGSIEELRKNVLSPKFNQGQSIWLPTSGIASLSPQTALVGHDGWYDGGWTGYGNWWGSKLGMADYELIQELRGPRSLTYDSMQYYAKQAAKHAREFVPKAFETHDVVYFATHVSPYPETSLAPNGKISDPDWMPCFCTYNLGQELLDIMDEQPEGKELIVLCGHSHTPAFCQKKPNIKAFCGKASYGKLIIAGNFDV